MICVLRSNHNQLDQLTLNRWQSRTLYALAACRIEALGSHIDKCDNPSCNQVHISYNSCRNHHCPKCQGHKQEQWILARESDLINVPYYHIVFTLPGELNKLCFYSPAVVYGLLFKVAWSVIKDFASNPKFLGAKTGMVSIIHTWGQNLSLHPHLHCIVPSGGVSAALKWKQAKGKDKYLFPVKAMSNVFRARFVEGLRKVTTLEESLYKQLFVNPWVIYCKRPFFGPQQVVEYLGRYTHKVAISNHRIKSIKDGNVTFTAKDYRYGGRKHNITLSEYEFIRRFSLHILPKGFTRIRHYGILSSSLKKSIIPLLQDELGSVTILKREPLKHNVCRICGVGKMVTIQVIFPRGLPMYNSRLSKK
jgi:putative transposase/transposase-like zinc-binding protein